MTKMSEEIKNHNEASIDRSPDEDMSRAEMLFQAGQLDEARVLLENTIRDKPAHYEAMNNLGTVLYRQGHVADAEQLYLQALSIKADDADILSNLSDLYISLKRWEEAVLFMERYIRRSPDDVNKLNQLALAYMESGNPGRAVPVLETSLALQPDQEDVRNILDTLKSTAPAAVPHVRTMRPVISVGLPVYNGGNLLPQAIESILSQDFADFELIISDNGSTDQTREVCLSYQEKDHRVRYHRFEENLGAATNFLEVLGHASAPFYMWASHDDLRDKTFMSACVAPLLRDPSVALVYPRTKLLDADSHFMGIAQDRLATDQESPLERFKHLIWEIGICNAFYGLFRVSVIKKMYVWEISKTLLFGDNLALAEVALLGKIVQLEEPLFIRRLTRNYNYRSPDDRNKQLMAEIEPKLLKEGISFPHCRLAYAHLDLLNQSALSDADKDILMKEVFDCFRSRFGPQMTYEIDRAVALIDKGIFYHQWDQMDRVEIHNEDLKALYHYRTASLLKRLQEALFFFPERNDAVDVYSKCLDTLNASRAFEASGAPGFASARDML